MKIQYTAIIQMLHTSLSSHFRIVFLSQTNRSRNAITRIIRSQIDRETFMIADTSLQNDQAQLLNDQNTQILSAKDNFHVDLDVNVVDSNEQRVIDDAQADILRNADVISDDVSRAESNVVSNEVSRVVSTSSTQVSFIRTFAHRAKNVFSKDIIRIIFKMSNARASKTIRLIEFVLWSENLFRNIFHDERSKVVKESDFYQTKNQHELNIFLRKCMQIFEIRFMIYRRDLDRVQYAQMWFTNDIFDVWYRKYESMNEDFSWKLFKKTLQEHLASQRLRIINVKQKFKEFKQRLKQFVSQLCAHLNSLKNQLSKRSHESQRASHLLFALHFYIRDAIIRKHENCTTRMQIEKTVLLIERIESNFDMSNRYRRKTFQNLNRSRSQITINKLFARASFRRFNSIEREREYSSVLSESNRKSQTSIRFNRVDQATQKWRNFVARFSNASHQRVSLSSKRKNEMICNNCDKQNHVRSKCLISLSKTSLKYAKKDRDL